MHMQGAKGMLWRSCAWTVVIMSGVGAGRSRADSRRVQQSLWHCLGNVERVTCDGGGSLHERHLARVELVVLVHVVDGSVVHAQDEHGDQVVELLEVVKHHVGDGLKHRYTRRTNRRIDEGR